MLAGPFSYRQQDIIWMMGAAVLWMIFMFSSLSIIYVKHQIRHLYTQLQAQERIRDQLQITWGKLLLEKEALTSGARVERLARQQLNMSNPVEIKIIKP